MQACAPCIRALDKGKVGAGTVKFNGHFCVFTHCIIIECGKHVQDEQSVGHDAHTVLWSLETCEVSVARKGIAIWNTKNSGATSAWQFSEGSQFCLYQCKLEPIDDGKHSNPFMGSFPISSYSQVQKHLPQFVLLNACLSNGIKSHFCLYSILN
jgi:hypothetical protein